MSESRAMEQGAAAAVVADAAAGDASAKASLGDASPGGVAGDAAPRGAAGEAPRTSRLFYGLGLGLQTLLWFLLFLAIVVAVAVGGELTEFRYVGF